jgi:hypothetical protein
MGFDAAIVVQPLDWDFSAFGGGKGVVPEPSDKAIDTLFKDLAKVTQEMLSKAGVTELAQDASAEQVMQSLSDLPDGLGIEKMVSGFTKAFAKMCQNQPSAIQLNKLPMRVRMRFYIWLIQEIRPEADGVGSINQLNGMPRIGLGA